MPDRTQQTAQPPPSRIHIIRHGQSLHNIERGYPHRDPPLTEKGEDDAKNIKIPNLTNNLPDLILISPMTRTIQTAILALPTIFQTNSFKSQVQVQIWPNLRESHDATCNKGLSRADLIQKFPNLDFTECAEEWDYTPHTTEDATLRAETVRKRLEKLATSGLYRDIVVITHRGFIAFLVRGERFDVCETRAYRFASEMERKDEMIRWGRNVDTGEWLDFGPSLLVPVGGG